MPTAVAQSEAGFQRAVMTAAKLHGWLCVHYRPGLTRSGRWLTPVQGDAGGPDLLLARRGAVILAELKLDNGRLTPAQRAWAAALGDRYRLWRPAMWGEILEALK